MAKYMAEIEKGAHTAFAFVGGNGCGLCLAAFHDGMDACLDIACLEAVEIGFEPVKEIAVADQPVFHDFGIACEKFTHGQRFKRVRIRENETRLMESTGEVLALLRVDAGLAANGTVHLREKCGRDLREIDTAPQDRCCKAGEVADDAAAQ